MPEETVGLAQAIWPDLKDATIKGQTVLAVHRMELVIQAETGSRKRDIRFKTARAVFVDFVKSLPQDEQVLVNNPDLAAHLLPDILDEFK